LSRTSSDVVVEDNNNVDSDDDVGDDEDDGDDDDDHDYDVSDCIDNNDLILNILFGHTLSGPESPQFCVLHV